MTLRFSIQSALGLMLLAHAVGVQAQPATVSEDAVANPDGPTGATEEVAGPVLLELLEFSGEFTTEDGEWVDPTLLLEADDEGLAGAARDGTRELGAPQDEQAAPIENCISPQCE